MKHLDKISKLIGIIIFILIIVIALYSLIFVFPKRKKEIIKEEDKVLDYVLYDKDTELYKEIFNKLKEEVNNGEKNYEKYATYISELFIVDLYTLSNKNNKEDVTSKMYVKEDFRKNFVLNVSNTLYKYIGTQKELPTVTSIELKSIEKINYVIDKDNYEAYKVSLEWSYGKDLNYDKKGNVFVILDNDKLYIVEKNNE